MHNGIEKSFVTIREMLTDRGEDVASLQHLSGKDIAALASSRTIFHFDVPSCKHRVIYNLNAKFRPAEIRKLLDEEGVTTIIVVAREKPTHANCRKLMEDVDKDLQIFDIRELQYNVSRHVLVPRHEPIRDEAEIHRILQRYNLKSRFLMPIIFSTDVMARYLALKHGQLVRIIRPSPSAGTYVPYRCCMRST